MTPEIFIKNYENALSTQDWKNIEPLIHENACVTFSTGTVHKGKHEVQKAFERNFSVIKEEQFSISNIHWIKKNKEVAVYLFDFSWQGIVNGQQAEGSGRGTSVLINQKGEWKL